MSRAYACMICDRPILMLKNDASSHGEDGPYCNESGSAECCTASQVLRSAAKIVVDTSSQGDRRRIRVEWRAPGKAVVNSIPVELRGDEKVRLLIVRAGSFSTRQVTQACESAGLYPGAVVLTLPPGGEFEVWEEP